MLKKLEDIGFWLVFIAIILFFIIAGIGFYRNVTQEQFIRCGEDEYIGTNLTVRDKSIAFTTTDGVRHAIEINGKCEWGELRKVETR